MHAPLSASEKTAVIDGRNAPIGALRAFVTLLVIFHHTAMTYHP
ncbi:hypothetical protein [Caulobacter endophyticus]|nr:hypothetical protein [Caulobacter endophyticus]